MVAEEKEKEEQTQNEVKLIEFIRQFGYGTLLIAVQDGQPVRIVKTEQSIKL